MIKTNEMAAILLLTMLTLSTFIALININAFVVVDSDTTKLFRTICNGSLGDKWCNYECGGC